MKTRTDFVSNSSSCSFIVHDIPMFIEKLKTLSPDKTNMGIDISWLYEIDVRFNIKSTEDNKKVFKDFIDKYTYVDGGFIFCDGDFEKFLAIDPKHYNQISHFEMYAYDDCDDRVVQKLALLYWALRSEGVDVDDSESEHEFSLFKDVPVPIINAAIKMFQPKQELN